MKTLIIAEKPSVATDIARVIGGLKKNGDYYEGDNYIVGNALGHLLELACPEKYEVKRGKWTFAHLPVLPPTFDLKPISRTADKLKSLAKLIKRPDVGEIVNACDAGREGELIFRYIMQATKAKQPIKRLWLQSMTAASIREALGHLRTDEEMQSLAAAAKSRSEADWLVGINGTRAMTAFNSLGGGFYLLTSSSLTFFAGSGEKTFSTSFGTSEILLADGTSDGVAVYVDENVSGADCAVYAFFADGTSLSSPAPRGARSLLLAGRKVCLLAEESLAVYDGSTVQQTATASGGRQLLRLGNAVLVCYDDRAERISLH